MQFLSNKEDYELTIDDIKPYLTNAKERGEHIVCACPICESNDKKGHHLYITVNKGKLLLYCQHCHVNGGEIFKEFRRLGAKHEMPSNYVAEKPSIIEDYDHEYRNPDGTLAYCKRRIKYSNGSKTFRFHYKDEYGRDVWKKPADCNTLYNLDLMQCALERGDEIPTLYIVEGEKCADALVGVGVLATTSNTGAKEKLKFSATDIAMLSKFPVKVIIPDNDEIGSDYIKAWSGASVLCLKDIWPDCPPKGDIADYIEKGLPIEPIVNYKSYSLEQDDINKMSATELINLDFLKTIYRVKDALTRQGILSVIDIRAGELNCRRSFRSSWSAFIKDMASKTKSKGNRQQFDKGAPINGLACGEWQADMNGVKRFVNTADEDIDVEFASWIPITPSAILENIENGTEKAQISFYKKKTWHSINVARSIIANTSKIVDLADLGIDVNSGSAKLLVKYLADVINSNDETALPVLQTVSHLGWVGDKFIPYDTEIVTDVSTEYQDTVNAVSECGDLDEWVEFVKPLRKNIYLRVALATSFASPLIEKVHALPFVLMLWGGSGAGKTVALQVAASVWGNPNMGKMVKSLNNTINFTMSMLGTLKHLPFFGDELQTIREKYGGYDELLYRVTEGVDRGRMTNSIVQKTNSWQNCMIFTGEEPCTVSHSGGGTKNRCIEVECRDKIIEDGHAVSSFVKGCYGCAGSVYIDALQNYDLLDEYRSIYKNIVDAADSTEKQVMAMALIMLGDKISSECIFHDSPMKTHEILDFLKSVSEVDVSARAYVAICDLINEHIGYFDGSNTNISWGKFADRTTVYINKSVLERELTNMGYNFNSVKAKWASSGKLIKNAQGRYYGRYWVNGNQGNYVVLNVSGNA